MLCRVLSRVSSRASLSSSLSISSCRCLNTRRDVGAALPFVENYRNHWPNTERELPEEVPEPYIPPRTISDSCLRFKLTSTFDRGSSIFYPQMTTHPGDLKVTLLVSLKDLPLNAEELKVFLRLVGTRYDPSRSEVRLNVKRFANRIENKRFSVLLLERLLAEARRITANGVEYEK